MLRHRHRIAKTDLGDLAALVDVGWRGPMCFDADALVLDKAAVPAARAAYVQILETPDPLVARIAGMHGDTPKSIADLLDDPERLVDPTAGKTRAKVLVQVFALVAAVLETAASEGRGVIVLHVDPER